MRKLIFIWVLLLFFCNLFSQVPDLNKYSTVAKRVDVINAYIEKCLKVSDFKNLVKASYAGINLARKEKNDTLLAKYQFRLGATYRLMSESDSALKYLKLADHLAYVSKKINLQILSQLELSYLYERMGKIDSLDGILSRLETMSHSVDSLSIEQGGIQNRMAINYYRKGKYGEAINCFLKGIKIFQYAKDSTLLAKMLANVGSVYYTIKQEKQGLIYLHQAERMLVLLGRDEDLAMGEVYFNMARANSGLDINDSAIYYYKKAVYIAGKYSNNYLLAFSYSGLGYNYLNKKEYVKAESFLNQGLELSEKYGIKPANLDIYERLGILYNREKSPIKAKIFFEKAFKLANDMKFRDRIADQYQNLAQTEAALGNFTKAYQYQKVYTTFKDSINTETSNKNIAEMESKYQTKKKQQEIALLDAQNKAQTLQLKSQKQVEYSLLAGFSLILIIAGLLWRSYRTKQKVNLELSEKNNEISAANEELTVLNEKLNESNVSKAKLFSIISHDLRSPVVSLFQYIKLQEQSFPQLDEQSKQKYNETIIQTAENLAEVMEDLLIWSKSQMEYFELSLESVSVKDLFVEIIQMHDIIVRQKRITVQMDCPPDLTFITDVNFLKIVIRNLVSNAIKFSPEKEVVQVSATITPDSLMLSVKNKGKGLTKEQIADLNNWKSIKSNPSGMGLKLTKEFVEKLNGTLEILSGTESGTEFLVNLKQIHTNSLQKATLIGASQIPIE